MMGEESTRAKVRLAELPPQRGAATLAVLLQCLVQGHHMLSRM